LLFCCDENGPNYFISTVLEALYNDADEQLNADKVPYQDKNEVHVVPQHLIVSNRLHINAFNILIKIHIYSKFLSKFTCTVGHKVHIVTPIVNGCRVEKSQHPHGDIIESVLKYCMLKYTLRVNNRQ